MWSSSRDPADVVTTRHRNRCVDANVATTTSVSQPRLWHSSLLLKRSGDRGWGTTVKWLSGLSLCACVRTCLVSCLFEAPLFPSRALLK